MQAVERDVAPVDEAPVDVLGHVGQVQHGDAAGFELHLEHVGREEADAQAFHHRVFHRLVARELQALPHLERLRLQQLFQEHAGR